MRIAEIYKSIQGEGLLTGTESVFVRASGCNLRCRFCDTPYTSWHAEGDDLSVEDVIQQINTWRCSHVVLTGGEPMLYSELIPLCAQLRTAGRHITIETAGTLFLPLCCDLMSISPKLSNSTPSAKDFPRWSQRHERTRHAPDVIRQLVSQYAYQIKFVIDAPSDCQQVDTYLEKFPEIERSCIMLMPQGTDQAALSRTTRWLKPYCDEHGFLFCARKHIEWFGFTRGT